MQRFALILVTILSAQAVCSQNSLTGKILDSLTHKPIPYVNVFFANSTIGTVSDTTGSFTIKNIPDGKYDLTFSFVGYNTVQLSIDFPGSVQQVLVYLTEQIIQLKEVSVTADTSNWKSNFQQFKSYFLGSTQNASRTQILNPRTVRLYFDPSDRILTGRAKTEIEIENRALGYKIYYQLVEFVVDFANENMVYLGIPRFEELSPKGNREHERWMEERRRAYNGSFIHFIKSLKQNELEKNGFEAHAFFRVPNKSRPTDAFLNEKIKYWRERSISKGTIVIHKDDSLAYYYRLRSMPKERDSIGHKIIDVAELFSKGSNDEISYKGMLQVTYKNEREELNYEPSRSPLKVQVSIIHFTGNNAIKLYDNGYYESVRDVFFEGYMGWSEKLADLFPLGYQPETQ